MDLDFYTIPNQSMLEGYEKVMPVYMRPNRLPYMVVVPEYLNDDICDEIVQTFISFETYSMAGCDGYSRECPRPLHPILNFVAQCAVSANRMFWNYILDTEPAAWMQTYKAGNSYDLHMDVVPGQSRKLTAIALLSSSDEFEGGDLIFHLPPHTFNVPKKRGTVVVFLPWISHEVRRVTGGTRHTINMGFWGPSFR